MEYDLFYDLETGELATPRDFMDTRYSIRYQSNEGGLVHRVEIGDGFRHTQSLIPSHWNTLVRLIRDDKLDSNGLELILSGLLGHCLPENIHKQNFVSGIKSGTIKEI